MATQPKQIRVGTGSWKCPLCDKRFHSEKDKDIHMATDCKFQDPVEDKGKRRQSAVNPTRPSKDKLHQASSFVTSYSLNSKTPVTMKWFLRAGEQIREREIYFFSKNGEMFTFTSEDTKGLGNENKGCFRCDCVMEVGEHGGSLNVGNLGVFEVTPFKVERRDPSYQVTIKLAGRDDELHNGTKPTVQSAGNSRSQLNEDKGVSNGKLKQAEAEVQRLKKENGVVKEKLKSAEEKSQTNIVKLKARIADKEKEMSHRNEELQNAQEELGRFSEKSQAIQDRHGADRSKLDESLQLIEDYRKKIDKQKELISKLQKGVENNQNSKTQSNSEETTLQRELESLRSEIAAFYTERDEMFAQVQHFKSENEKLKHALTPIRSKSAEQLKKKIDEREEHIQLLGQKITDLEIEVKKKDELIQQSEDLRPKCSLLEKELNQFKSRMSVGNVYESNACNILEKERLLDITSKENQKLKQRMEELEMNMTLEESERQHFKTIVSNLGTENKNLQRIISVRDAESDDLRMEVARLGSELSKAQHLLASELNSKKEFVGQDENDSMFSMSQSLGPEFKRRSFGSSNIDETGGQNVRKQQSSSDEQGIKELKKQVSELNRSVEEMRTELELHRKENHNLKGKFDTSKRELEIVSDKLVQSEQNLSAVQTYLDEAHYKEKEALNETAGKNKSISASRTNSATHKKDDKNTPKQPKYKYTDIFVGRNTKTYTLSQVEDLVGYLGGIVFCHRRTRYTTEYVAGTLQAIILPPRYGYEKTIAGIEFVDPLGDCDGEHNYKRYFTSKPKHALFIATDMVYIPCQDPK